MILAAQVTLHGVEIAEFREQQQALKRSAVLKIQAAWRGKTARDIARMLLGRRVLLRQTPAAICIQVTAMKGGRGKYEIIGQKRQ